MTKPKAIIVSGYFNPLHKGHLELFKRAKAYGDVLWVIVNSDLQRKLKGSKKLFKLNFLFLSSKLLDISFDSENTSHEVFFCLEA